MYILGINPGHDATACIIDSGGQILSAVAEERLSRIKFDFGLPYLAIEECLRLANLDPSEVRIIGVGFQSFYHPETPYWNKLLLKREPARFDFDDFRMAYENRTQAIRQVFLKNLDSLFSAGGTKSDQSGLMVGFTENTLKRTFTDLGFNQARVVTVDHHLAHAASAYNTSGFDNPLIVTCDGSGDGLCASINVLEKGKLKRLHGAPDMCSPGLVYSEVTHYLGFKRNRHEGKITGLAAYGNENTATNNFKRCMRLSKDGKSFIHDLDVDAGIFNRKLKTLGKLLKKQRIINDHITLVREFIEKETKNTSREDLSAGAQKQLEDCLVQYVTSTFKKGQWERVVLGGGVFANVKLNQRIAEIPGVKEIFVHPNMGDGGVAYGAAILATATEYPQIEIKTQKINDVYFGAEFSNEEIKKSLNKAGIEAEYYENIELIIAEYIANKKIVGRFNGRMEYGPRALGNRSILADPTDTAINDWLNKRLKRTEFMPFAPSVLDRAAPGMFKNFSAGSYTSSFMTITFDVDREWIERAPAVVHVDGTARPQVVKQEHNRSYYRILEEYERLSGLPLIVNTSFNMHEEPILNSPEDAFRSFDAGSVDILAIGNFIVEKKSR